MNPLVPGVPVMLGVAVLGINRVRGNVRPPKRGSEGPPPLLGVRRRTDAVAELLSAPPEPAGTKAAPGIDDAIQRHAEVPVVVDGVEDGAETVAVEVGAEAAIEPVLAAATPQDIHEVDEVAGVRGVRVVAPEIGTPTPIPEEPVLAPPSRKGVLRSAVAVVRRFLRRDGILDDVPVALAEDGMLDVLPEEHLPDTDAWEANRAEREAAFEAARAAAAERETELKAEDERREAEARKEAFLALERERENRGWWLQIDEDATSESDRMALVGSLGLVRMPWAHKLILRALREDESTRVRARAIGALVRGGWLDDPQPFDEVFAQNDRILNLAAREALMPHQDRLWVRNLFA